MLAVDRDETPRTPSCPAMRDGACHIACSLSSEDLQSLNPSHADVSGHAYRRGNLQLSGQGPSETDRQFGARACTYCSSRTRTGPWRDVTPITPGMFHKRITARFASVIPCRRRHSQRQRMCVGVGMLLVPYDGYVRSCWFNGDTISCSFNGDTRSQWFDGDVVYVLDGSIGT
ncbi:hypothetical protein BaRGS_00001447 [Batillaria attramentaria]|uniref:Uncharacterized protein n=1 Tax=Batillaria attramentaria TaxID=370345 RepID=A0ABD0M756_9CAEN